MVIIPYNWIYAPPTSNIGREKRITLCAYEPISVGKSVRMGTYPTDVSVREGCAFWAGVRDGKGRNGAWLGGWFICPLLFSSPPSRQEGRITSDVSTRCGRNAIPTLQSTYFPHICFKMSCIWWAPRTCFWCFCMLLPMRCLYSDVCLDIEFGFGLLFFMLRICSDVGLWKVKGRKEWGRNNPSPQYMTI